MLEENISARFPEGLSHTDIPVYCSSSMPGPRVFDSPRGKYLKLLQCLSFHICHWAFWHHKAFTSMWPGTGELAPQLRMLIVLARGPEFQTPAPGYAQLPLTPPPRTSNALFWHQWSLHTPGKHNTHKKKRNWWNYKSLLKMVLGTYWRIGFPSISSTHYSRQGAVQLPQRLKHWWPLHPGQVSSHCF